MKKGKSVFLSVVIGLASLALIASATPLAVTGHPTGAQVPAQAQSITGKIASVEKSSFTLSVGSAVAKEGEAQQTNEKTMKFDVDKNTTIDGKLQVGKTADVTYRENNGSYLAISVRVEP
jgi:hypothetical protein